MASLLSHEVLELPQDIVTASPGLGFDIGSSLAKIVYRSNKEYKEGIPLGKGLDPQTGRVHLAKFLRENTEDVIAFIEENCDFNREEDGVAHICATGVGGSQFKAQIEEKLKIKIKVLAEFDCFVHAFKRLTSTVPKEQLLCAIPAKAKEESERIMKLVKDWLKNVDSSMMEGSFPHMAEGGDTVETGDDTHLPCMLVMSGWGAAVMHIKEDGTYEMVESIHTAGRTFLGLVAASTGEKDFGKMMEMAAHSDGRTATTFMSDMKAEGPQEEADLYSSMMEMDLPLFPMGKVYTAKREHVKDGDIIQSILYLFGLVHAQIVGLQCMLNGVKKAYFCGNFIQNELVHGYTMMMQTGRNMTVPADMRVDFQFLRNGGVYGALGAFFSSCESSSDRAATISEDTAL